MYRTMIASLVAGILLASDASAQDFKKNDDKELKSPVQKSTPNAGQPIKTAADIGIPGDVEISFLNGSMVRMILQSDKLDVATPYGKLAIPVEDIRAIEFGIHFPDGIDSRIQQAIKTLGGENYADRDLASKTLVQLGPYSFPAVFEATRAPDLETSNRAKTLLKQLQAKHPKKDLKVSVEDRVITPSFTVVGRILTPSLKAKAELFGDVNLPVARMRGLRALNALGQDIDVIIDAGKYAVQGQWMETDFKVDGRSAITVTAKGSVDCWPQQQGQFQTGPNGLQGRGQGMNVFIPPGRRINGPLNNQTYGGMLIGKIGEDGQPFTIGEHYEGTPETQGKLYLHIGPSPWNVQSVGSYEVKIGRKS